MLSKEQYLEFYHKYGRCVDQMQRPKNKLNERQLENKYGNYVRKEERKQLRRDIKKVDEEWETLRAYVLQRDAGICRLYRLLTPNERRYFKECGGYLFKVLDGAHVIARSLSKNLYYEPRNVVLLDRVFHSRLDFGQNPLNGKVCSRDEIEWWWRRIVGDTDYEWLLKNK
jgi:hypothetical protein